jgi:hypothetical protein
MDRLPNEILSDAALDEIETKPRRAKNPIDHWTPSVLLERAAYLRKLAKHGDGCASETLKEFPQHCAMLSFRSRSGEAEVHEKCADLFVVLAGSGTLLTGGVVTAARSIAPGETRGAGIEGGARQTLRAGDPMPTFLADGVRGAAELLRDKAFEQRFVEDVDAVLAVVEQVAADRAAGLLVGLERHELHAPVGSRDLMLRLAEG